MNLTNQVSERYNSSTPEQKNYVSIGLTLGLLIILIALIYPAVRHILNLRTEINEGRQVLQKLEQKSQDLAQAEIHFEAVKPELDTLQLALPNGSAVTGYIKRPLEDLARQHRLTVTGLQFDEVPLSLPPNDESLRSRSLEYTFAVSGDFANLNNFVADLEKFIRTTEVTAITLVGIKNGDVTADLRAVTNYMSSQSLDSAAGGNR